MIDKWASFLANEKLTPARVPDPMVLVRLAEELAKRQEPRVRPHALQLASRRLVAATAIDLGIDLSKIKYRGKVAMSRGLLDAWNQENESRFGSNVGTAGWKEGQRRDARTRVVRRNTTG